MEVKNVNNKIIVYSDDNKVLKHKTLKRTLKAVVLNSEEELNNWEEIEGTINLPKFGFTKYKLKTQ